MALAELGDQATLLAPPQRKVSEAAQTFQRVRFSSPRSPLLARVLPHPAGCRPLLAAMGLAGHMLPSSAQEETDGCAGAPAVRWHLRPKNPDDSPRIHSLQATRAPNRLLPAVSDRPASRGNRGTSGARCQPWSCPGNLVRWSQSARSESLERLPCSKEQAPRKE